MYHPLTFFLYKKSTWPVGLVTCLNQSTRGQALSLAAPFPWRRKCQPTPVFLPGESHGQRRLVGYSPWGCKELDTTEQMCVHTHTHRHNLKIDPEGWNHCSISFSLCATEVSYQIKWQKEKGRAESESYFDGVTSRGRFGAFQLQDFLFEFFK